MLDIKWIRENQKEFDNLLVKRGYRPQAHQLITLDEDRRQVVTLIQQFQHAKKEKSKILIGSKNNANKDIERIKQDIDHINEKLEELSKKLDSNNQLQEILDSLPNILEADVPNGVDETQNTEIRIFGEPVKIKFARQHFEIGEKLGMMDFSQTAKISGSRFSTLSKDLARLERALVNFMLDTHTKEFGFTEVSPPYLVRNAAMYNAGQLPKFAADSFETTNEYRLIPTGEVPLVNLVADKILAHHVLPVRFVAYTPCFRSEAGSAGRDTRGIVRVHQFGKVELVSVTEPSEANAEHEFITNAAEQILKYLELPYRVMLLCSGETGFTSKKTYDIEVWLPGQQRYREIASCSNCGDFQARRMRARYKEIGANDTKFVHTLNASGLAVGRTIVGILENYQNEDGSVSVPKVLVPYMNGISTIVPDETII